MGQRRRQDNIPPVVRASGTSLTLAATNAGLAARITVGGQQYKTPSAGILLNTGTAGFNGIDTGSFTAATIYNIFAVVSGGILGMVLSTATSPSGFTSYKFLGKLIAATGATISHVMNVGEPFIEYVSNSSTTDAEDLVSFSYGIEGSLIPTIAASTNTGTRAKLCRFLVTVDQRDVFVLQATPNAGGALNLFSDLAACSDYDVSYQNIQIQYGMGMERRSDVLTDVEVRFGRGGRSSQGATYGSAGANFPANVNDKWRLLKISRPVLVP